MKLQDHKYKNLEKDLQNYKKILSDAADAILNQEISSYPIFVLHQAEIELGITLESKLPGIWRVNVSTLEEFVSKNLIVNDKVDDFRSVYKNPEEHLCLFVVDEIGATFVFISKT